MMKYLVLFNLVLGGFAPIFAQRDSTPNKGSVKHLCLPSSMNLPYYQTAQHGFDDALISGYLEFDDKFYQSVTRLEIDDLTWLINKDELNFNETEFDVEIPVNSRKTVGDESFLINGSYLLSKFTEIKTVYGNEEIYVSCIKISESYRVKSPDSELEWKHNNARYLVFGAEGDFLYEFDFVNESVNDDRTNIITVLSSTEDGIPAPLKTKIKSQFNCNISPMPIVNKATLNFSGSQELINNLSITMFDMSGRKIMQKNITNYNTSNPLEIDVVGINPGQYVIQISATEFAMSKLIYIRKD